MINQQLLTYIKSQQEAGTDDAKIKENLQSAGWREGDIEEGFQAVKNDMDGGNSPEAHQKIRADAAKERGAQPTTSGQTDDAYREPVTEADQTGSSDTGDEPSLSPIDEDTAGDSTGQTREMKSADSDGAPADSGSTSDSDSQPDNTEQQMAQEKPEDTGPKEINDSKSSTGNPLASDESIHKMKGHKDDIHKEDDADPVAVRTFASDRERMGISRSSSNSGGIDLQKSKAKRKQSETQQEVNKLAGVTGASDTKKESTEANESPESQKQRRGPNKEINLDTQKSSQPAKSQQPSVGAKDSQANAMGMSAGNEVKQESAQSARKKSRQPVDGGQRFSTSKDVQAAKKRAAERQKQARQKSSGSNVTSILIFILAFLLVGGGGVYGYMTFFQAGSSDTTASEVMQSLAEAETFNFRTTVESANNDGAQKRLIIEGAVDLSQNTDSQSYYVVTEESQGTLIQAVMAETENVSAVPSTQMEMIRDIILSPDFLTIGEFQTQEQLANFTTNRFRVSADTEQLVSDYATFHQAFFDTPLSQSVLSRLQKYVGGFEPTQGQAWIDPDSGVPYQITFIGTGAEGQEMQVNLQFKNHGTDLGSTPTYSPQSFEQVLSEYFGDSDDSEDTTTQEDQDTSTTTTEPDEDQNQPQEDEETQATTSEPSDDEEDDSAQQAIEEANRIRRQDQLRVNDVQQISVALRLYAQETGSFPTSLNQLLQAGGDVTVLSSIPRDPASGDQYLYSVSEQADRYHLGSVLRNLSRIDVISNDANFNSRGQGFPNGFNGATTDCGQSQITSATTCYDITGGME